MTLALPTEDNRAITKKLSDGKPLQHQVFIPNGVLQPYNFCLVQALIYNQGARFLG